LTSNLRNNRVFHYIRIEITDKFIEIKNVLRLFINYQDIKLIFYLFIVNNKRSESSNAYIYFNYKLKHNKLREFNNALNT